MAEPDFRATAEYWCVCVWGGELQSIDIKLNPFWLGFLTWLCIILESSLAVWSPSSEWTMNYHPIPPVSIEVCSGM